MTLKATRIKNPSQLNEALAKGHTTFAIVLSGGLCFSRKEITRASRYAYRIHHHIDDSKETLPVSALFDARRTNIGHAMKCGAFVRLTEKH